MTPEGYLVISSGGTPLKDGEREYAGVGFIVAPEAKASIIGYLQHSSRLAVLKMKVKGGSLAILSVYAPPGTRPHEERQQFYTALGDAAGRVSVHGPKILAGDFNARLHDRQGGEESILGPGVFGKKGHVPEETTNRSLFVELCARLGLCALNTLEDRAPEDLVTYRDLGTKIGEPVTYPQYAQLDYILAPQTWKGIAGRCGPNRHSQLASHHYLVSAVLDVEVPVQRQYGKKACGPPDMIEDSQ